MKTPINKEQIYDSQINPLMAQIIDICQANKIAMIASFALPTPEDGDLQCTTALLADGFNPPDYMLNALAVLRPPERKPFMTKTQHADGSITLTAVLG